MEDGLWITLKVSTSVLRTINKKGVDQVLKDAKKRGTLAKDLAGLVR